MESTSQLGDYGGRTESPVGSIGACSSSFCTNPPSFDFDVSVHFSLPGCVEALGVLDSLDFLLEQFRYLGQKAFFSHLRSGTAPPKHGHIFMHPWISRSPRWVRGKIARMLASRLVSLHESMPLRDSNDQDDVDNIETKVRLFAKNFRNLQNAEVVK